MGSFNAIACLKNYYKLIISIEMNLLQHTANVLRGK